MAWKHLGSLFFSRARPTSETSGNCVICKTGVALPRGSTFPYSKFHSWEDLSKPEQVIFSLIPIGNKIICLQNQSQSVCDTRRASSLSPSSERQEVWFPRFCNSLREVSHSLAKRLTFSKLADARSLKFETRLVRV